MKGLSLLLTCNLVLLLHMLTVNCSPAPRRNPMRRPAGIIGKIGTAVNGLVESASCTASNLITEMKMKDDAFLPFQVNCVTGRGPCDDIGNIIKILGPEVVAGRCPSPCNRCTQKQIRRVMEELSNRLFPQEFQEMMRKIS